MPDEGKGMPGIDYSSRETTFLKEAPAEGQAIMVKEGEEPPPAPDGFYWKEGSFDRQWVLTDLANVGSEEKELKDQLRDLQLQLEEKERQEKRTARDNAKIRAPPPTARREFCPDRVRKRRRGAAQQQ